MHTYIHTYTFSSSKIQNHLKLLLGTVAGPLTINSNLPREKKTFHM